MIHQPDNPAPKETRSKGTDQRDQDDTNDKPDTRDLQRVPILQHWQQADDLPVNQLDCGPGDIDSQQHRRSHQNAGKEP